MHWSTGNAEFEQANWQPSQPEIILIRNLQVPLNTNLMNGFENIVQMALGNFNCTIILHPHDQLIPREEFCRRWRRVGFHGWIEGTCMGTQTRQNSPSSNWVTCSIWYLDISCHVRSYLYLALVLIGPARVRHAFRHFGRPTIKLIAYRARQPPWVNLPMNRHHYWVDLREMVSRDLRTYMTYTVHLQYSFIHNTVQM